MAKKLFYPFFDEVSGLARITLLWAMVESNSILKYRKSLVRKLNEFSKISSKMSDFYSTNFPLPTTGDDIRSKSNHINFICLVISDHWCESLNSKKYTLRCENDLFHSTLVKILYIFLLSDYMNFHYVHFVTSEIS